MNIDSALVRELAELLAETGLSEIEVEDGDRKIRVSRQMIQQMSAALPAMGYAPAGLPAAPAAAPVAEAAPA
ncbi:acetyl-CoA carboxylase, biotin carboxyl carrier protein, partial [Novosphingobium sp. 1949]|nr:acetyl-CoA carboxylase, biotin carboxyl carrier protein [Novosphingobium organovorum]